jgi:hypothetical protein
VPFPLTTIAILSLETTRALVTLGYGLGYDTDAATANAPGRYTSAPSPTTNLPYPPLAIVACTGNGVSPIVVTTAYPHGVSPRAQACGGMSCVVTGVLGNTAANNIDADPLSITRGLPAGTLAVPLTATTLALYGQDTNPASTTYGALIPLAGNGTYTSGGTIVPALGDGSILIGRDATREQSSPPRIVLVPRSVTSAPRRASLPSRLRNADRQREIRQRSIGTDVHAFDVHAWGASTPPDAAQDFLAADALRECVRASLHNLACGTADTGAGTWDDQAERATQQIKAGRLLSFGITIEVPVLDNPIAGGLPFVPAHSTMTTTVQSTTPEVAATFPITITPG